MKTRTASSLFLVLTITAVLALAARNVAAQDSTTANVAQAAPVQLSYGVAQIIQLSKANVSEGTIISYIQNSGSSYGLDANQIVYLKQEGVSDAVINTMLNQPRPVAQAADQTAPPQNPSSAVAQPVAASVQTIPSSTVSVYYVPNTQASTYYAASTAPYYYYPYGYGCYAWPYPAVAFGFGYGGGYRGYYHGGYRGSFHGGGWHH